MLQRGKFFVLFFVFVADVFQTEVGFYCWLLASALYFACVCVCVCVCVLLLIMFCLTRTDRNTRLNGQNVYS